MNIINQIKTIFSFFLKISLKSRRTKIFLILSLIPSLIIMIVNIAGKGEANTDFENLFYKIGMIFFFGFFIQVLSLFFGTSIINDEIHDKTLIYLTTKPVSKSSILIGKFIANYLISLILIAIGITVAYISSLNGNSFYFSELISIYGTVLIALFSYMGLFTLFGTRLKRPIMIGLIFCFGWEPIAKLIAGTIQNFSLAFYINKLIPNNILEYKSFPSSISISISILLLSALFFIGFSIFIFVKKEYILSDAS